MLLNSSLSTAEPENVVGVLLPNRTDEPLDELGNAVFLDAGAPAPVSPVDMLLMAFARRLLAGGNPEQAGVILLPRSQHRTALLLAITEHLLCRRTPVQLQGPVFFVGFDIDIAAQLRHLDVQNHRRMGLSDGNPLSVHRLSRIGEVKPVVGSRVDQVDRSLVYFNTRVGRPPVSCGPPLVVVDGTSVQTPTARQRALEWARDLGAATVVVLGDIADEGLVHTVTSSGFKSIVLSLDPDVTTQLIDELGQGRASSSTLSSSSVLQLPRTKVTLHTVPGQEVNEAVTTAFSALLTKPAGPLPSELDLAVSLLRNGSRLAATVVDYRRACVNNVRPGEYSSARMLTTRREYHLPPEWRGWKAAQLGNLTTSVQAIWRILETEGNPKLLELWRVLYEVERNTEGGVAIRCHSRAAVEATRASLSSGDRTEEQEILWMLIEDRVQFLTFKDRIPAGAVQTQVLTGAPPPWLFSVFEGDEAETTVVLCYEMEELTLRRQGKRWAESASGLRRALCQYLGARELSALETPFSDEAPPLVTRVEGRLRITGLKLSEVLDLAATVLDPPDDESTEFSGAGSGTRRCIPVSLDDGRTWWCADEGSGGTPVLTITAAGHENIPVGELRPGDRIVVPAGEGTESVHARLVAACHGNADVRALDLILSQFRMAARSLLEDGTRADAVARVRSAGADAPDQLQNWARGTTIAPREPEDVRAVFVAAQRPCPDLGLIYAVASTLRSLHRTLGRFVSAIAAGRGDGAVDKLREIVGDEADALLDEFIVAKVVSLGEPRFMSSSWAGKVR